MTTSDAPIAYRETLASYGDYESAQAAVDTLSDSGFPVEHTAIVGHGVTIVVDVQGRMSKGRAAGLGAASGAWFGLFLGILFGLFVPGIAWLGVVLTAVGIGAVWGAIFGFLGHLATGGRRDFRSSRSLAAERYDVVVDAQFAAQARGVLFNVAAPADAGPAAAPAVA